jgi:DNA mismatch repair protein MutS2
VGQLHRLLTGGDSLRPEPVADISPLLAELRAPGAVLDGAALLELGRACEAMRLVRADLDRVRHAAPLVAALAVEIPPPRLGRDLVQTFEPDGRVRDGADAGVDRARTCVRDTRAHLIHSLERTLRGLAGHEAAADAAVTIRNGRYVIPIQRDARGRVPGLVHAESASGATLFVEPHATVELGNELAAAEADEARAVHAVLRRLCDAARPHAVAAADGLAMCVAVDDLYARARYAADVAAHVPRLGPPGGSHRLRGARHPLLLAEGVAAVPFDLDLDPTELALVVSGPNTGGKTVLLKAIGLTSALVQAGVVPPLGADSEVPVYGTILADIGDNQSIAASLSTFSAHLAALREAVERAGAGTLVLLDEVGSGTDPVEGAALAAAVLETLVARGSRVVATTHLGALKRLAAETAGVVNASLHFDAATLTPTYELVKGVPGRSYGLVIARRLGLPDGVLARAEARRPAGERSLDALLAEVEQRAAAVGAREREVAERASLLEARAVALESRRATLEERDRELRERETTAEREGRAQARRYLLEARRRVDEAVADVRAAGATQEAARAARRKVEDGIAAEAAALARIEGELAKKGWRVRQGSGERGAVPSGAIRPAGAARRRSESEAASGGTAPRSPLPSEVDLRGLTAEEARDAVARAVDAAVLADLPAVRVIHGKGTGVLRGVVDEVLRADRRIAAHRLAPRREGGSGVTIADLA